MDIHGNSGANTCKDTQPHGRVAFISYLEPITGNRASGDHNDGADRISMRQFVQVSDLSAPVGRVLAYRGCDG